MSWLDDVEKRNEEQPKNNQIVPDLRIIAHGLAQSNTGGRSGNRSSSKRNESRDSFDTRVRNSYRYRDHQRQLDRLFGSDTDKNTTNRLQKEVDWLEEIYNKATNSGKKVVASPARPGVFYTVNSSSDEKEKYLKQLQKNYGYQDIDDLWNFLQYKRSELNTAKTKERATKNQFTQKQMENMALSDPDFNRLSSEGEGIATLWHRGKFFDPKEAGLESNMMLYGSDEQKRIYYYYVGKAHQDSNQKKSIRNALDGSMNTQNYVDMSLIHDYLYSVEDSLVLSQAKKDIEKNDTTAEKLLYSAKSGIDQWKNSTSAALQKKERYNPTATEIASASIRESLPQWGRTVFDVGSNIANQAIPVLAGVLTNVYAPGIGSYLSLGMTGVSAYGGAYKEKVNNGWSEDSARKYATIVGTSEVALGKILSGLAKGFGVGTLTQKALGSMIKGIDNAAVRYALSYGGAMLSEGFEEGLQEFLSPFFENLALGYEENSISDVDMEEVAYNGLIGFLTAGTMNVGSSQNAFVENNESKATGRLVRENRGTKEGAEEVFQIASSSPDGSDARNLYNTYTKRGITPENATDLQVGRLYEMIDSDAQRVFERGIGNENTAEDMIAYADASERTHQLFALLRKQDSELTKGEHREINEILDFYRSEEGRPSLEALLEEAKESGRNTSPSKLAEEIEQLIDSGGEVSRDQVKKLITYTDIYIANEEMRIKGVFDKNTGTKSNFATQKDVEQYVEYAYLYADETKGRGNIDFPKQKDKIVISKADERLIKDVKDNYGIDLSNAYHELNDNDIRHIKNSHGEESNEKYPVTIEDLKKIPDIIKNYDDVLYVERNGKKGFYYVKQHNGVTYYLEATNDKNTVLSNKQMIKVSTGTLPNIPELRDAIHKKWNINSAPDDSVPRMYVQDVKNYVPESTIPQGNRAVNDGAEMSPALYVENLTRNGETITVEEAKAASGYGVYGANVLADAVNNAEGQTFSQVKGDMHLAYLNGRVNKGMRFETDLQREAYYAGKKDAELGRLIAKKKAGYTTVYGEESGFIPNDASKNVSPKMQKALNIVAKDLGVKVMFADNIFVNKDGAEANASMGDDGIFRISASSTQPLHELIIHEPFHRMRQLATQEYFDAMNFAVQHAEQLGLRLEQGNGAGTYYEALNNLFTEKGISHDDAKILDELAAQFYQKIVSDDADALRFIQEMNKTEKSRSALQKFMDYVKELIGKLQKVVRKLRNQGEYAAAKQMDMTIKELETARKFYLNAYRATSQRVENRRVEQTWNVTEETNTDTAVGKEMLQSEDANGIMETSASYALSSGGKKGKRQTSYHLKVFPPFDESRSDANEISTRWAHQEDVEEGAMKIAFYHNGVYLIEKTNDSDLGYRIIRKISQREYDKWLQKNRSVQYGKDTGKQSNGKDVGQSRGGNRGNDTDGRVKSGSNRDSVRHRGKVQDVSGVDRHQDGWRGTEYERNGDYEHRFKDKQKSSGIIETSTGAKISYALDDEYWHTDLTKRQVKILEECLRRVGKPSATMITDTANWYMGRIDGNDVFAIYSTGDAKGPTILYETKTNAKLEKNILMDILEDEENGKSTNRKPSFTERLSKGDWVQNEHSMADSGYGMLGAKSGHRNATVLQGKSSSHGSRAFRNVVKNLLEIQESARSNEGVSYALESEVNESEQGEDILSDDGSKWKYSKSSGGQTQRVDGRSRRHKERGEAARKRRKYCQTLKNAGHTRKRVVLDHRCEVIPEKHYTSEMRKIVRENKKYGIDETILVVGGIKLPEVDSRGKVKTARGMFIEMNDGRKIIIIQCDNEYYSPDQINDHELVHNDYGSERTQRVKNIILKTLPEKKRNEILGIIQDDYSGMLEDLEGDALEELVANILSEMNYLSDDFLELSKAYWNRDDALLKRWEYEVSKKSFAKAVENSYADEMNRLNRQLAYDEHIQLREYIVGVNNSRKQILPTDCKEIGSNFYIWRNYNKNNYGVLFSIPIEGNEDIINATRSEISSGTYRGTENFNTRANRIRGGKRGSTVLDGRAERTTARRNDDRLFVGQPEGDTRGHSGKSRRDTSGNRIKYALDENGMWEMEQDRSLKEAESLEALVEKYGAIPVGEKPHREVSVPRKTAPGKKVSRTVRTVLEARVTPDEILPSIEKMIEDGTFSYTPYSDKQSLKDAERNINRYGWDESLRDWFRSVEKGIVSKEITSQGWVLYNNAVNTAATATDQRLKESATNNALAILDAMVKHQRSAAQALQATRILKKLSPETQMYSVSKSVQALQKELTDRYGDKAPNLKIDENLAEQFLSAKTEEKRTEIEKEIYKDIGRQMPSRFIDKWNAWRYLAMLGNVRTHVRNIVGNAGFAPVVMAKDLTATAIESVVYRISGKKMLRGKSLILGSKADRTLLKAAWEDYGNVAALVSNGGKYNDYALANQAMEEGRQIFKTKPLELARKGNSKLLEMEDVWFSKPHYAYALAQYCKANNITAEQIKKGVAIAPARDYAVKEAQKATYKDSNAFSQMVSDLGRVRKDEKNSAKKAVATVVEGTLPFRKTPANILVRGVEYSPIGLLKGLSYDLVQVGKGKMLAHEAIDHISAGLTGTGLLALGVYLAAQGLVRGHGEKEEEEREFKELMGHQAYSLELPNGTSITLDWLAPEALPFFVGVNLWETTRGTNEEVTFSTVLESISNVSEPMLEMSCLQSLNDLFESVGYASSNGLAALPTILSTSVTSYLSQGIPTLFGQAERTAEENRMSTYTGKDSFLTSDMQYILGKMSAKIPFVDYRQIPYIDAWGRKEASGVALKRGFNNFLNPAYTSDIETSEMEKELLGLYDRIGDSAVFPSRARKYFQEDGKEKHLTLDEYVRYATLKGEKSYDLLSDLVRSEGYRSLDDAGKMKAIKEAYSYADQKAKVAISNYKPESWIEDADRFGSDVSSYFSYKSMYSNAYARNGGKVSKNEVVDIILDVAQNDNEAWLMYLSKYENKSTYYAKDNGISGITYMEFLNALNEVDQPSKYGNYGSYTQAEARNAVEILEGLTQEEKAILWQSVDTDWKSYRNPYR